MPFKVQVSNFQSIKKANIIIEGFTVITGPNNSGKSALMRAIRGVFLNLGGTSFVRHGENQAEVTLSFDGHTVCWEKGKGGAQYTINQGKPLTNVGRGAPDAVLNLGVSAIRVGSDRKVIWPQIAEQFTGQVFLLNETGSIIAEAIADVDRVRALNLSLKDAESDRRSAKAKLKVRESDLLSIQNELVRYEGIDDVVSRLEALEEKAEQTRQLAAKVEALRKVRQRLREAEQRVQFLEGVQEITLPSEKRLREAQQAQSAVRQIGELQVRYAKIEQEIQRYSEVLDVQVELSDEKEKKLRKIIVTQELLEGFRDRIAKTDQTQEARKVSLSRNNAELEQVQEQIDSLLGEMEECPTCGRVFSPGDLDHGHF
jgi:exonuclease SbcC